MTSDPRDEPLDDIVADEELLPTEQQTENVGNAREVTKRRRKLDRLRDEEEQFLRAVLKDQVGRRVLWGILSAAHTFDTRFAVGPAGFPDPNATWFHAGEQALGQGLYHKWMTIDPQAMFLMLAENDSRFSGDKKRK